jgi:antitoxin (DNA-binding transcriptional repressor) of toxin-antitoxin stability system
MDDEVGMYEARTRFAELLTEVENDGVLLSPVTVIL